MKGMIVFLLGLALVAGGVAVAAFTVPANAAVVNGVGISQATLNTDLAAIAKSTPFQCFLRGTLLLKRSTADIFPVIGATGTPSNPMTYNTAFAAFWLQTMVATELESQLLARDGVRISAADRAAGRKDLEAAIGQVSEDLEEEGDASCGSPTAVLASLPASFVDRQVENQATFVALEAHAVGAGTTAAAVARYYAAHKSQFGQTCLGIVGFTSSTAAATARASLTLGSSFTSLGAVQMHCYPDTEVSQTPSISSLATGAVSQPLPVSTSSFYLVKVESRKALPLATARTEVLTQLQEKGEQKAAVRVESFARISSVSLDPRYGTYRNLAEPVLAPPEPSSTFVLNPAVDVPEATTATAPASGAAGSVPETAGTEPETAGTAPGTAGTAPGTAGAAPGTAGAAPGTAGAAPGTAGAAQGTTSGSTAPGTTTGSTVPGTAGGAG